MENMKLWDQVCQTNPKLTKQVNQRGGFTAVCAQAQRKRATELWGNYGQNWGLNEVTFGTINDGDGNAKEIYIDAVFYYPEGKFQISTDKIFKPGDDNRKKLITDATTKALSMLGFNSDIFEGKFDDNKYVTEMRNKFNKPKVDGSGKEPTEPKKAEPKTNLTGKETLKDLQEKAFKIHMGLINGKTMNAFAVFSLSEAHTGVKKPNECKDIEKLKAYFAAVDKLAK